MDSGEAPQRGALVPQAPLDHHWLVGPPALLGSRWVVEWVVDREQMASPPEASVKVGCRSIQVPWAGPLATAQSADAPAAGVGYPASRTCPRCSPQSHARPPQHSAVPPRGIGSPAG